jgi:hypothetical protein
MLDKVISLSVPPAVDAAAVSAVQATALVHADLAKTAPVTGTVEVEISSTPQCHARLRVWNAQGRNPTQPGQDGNTKRWQLGAPSVLLGCTLTWSVRLAPGPDGPSYFDLHVRLFQNGVALRDGDFFYSGPLDGLEERTGRFHFRAG